jgi:molybdopterin-containing oxidoreductase family iron-sulfur binding subunit
MTEESTSKFDESRRKFIRDAAVGVGGAALGVLFSDQLVEIVTGHSESDIGAGPTAKWGMVIDLDKCEGRMVWFDSCQKNHFLPKGSEWMVVYVNDGEEVGLPEPGHGRRLSEPYPQGDGEGIDENVHFLPRPCMHCDEPPCRNVCPVGATFKRDDGVVLVDDKRCIGCRYCMSACPYNARVFMWGEPDQPPEAFDHEHTPEAPWPHYKGTTTKCDFCIHEVKEGRLPHCADCPNGVIYFGDLREDAVSNGREILRFSTTIRDRGGFRLKSELGTMPRVWYLPKRV